jgi:tetratricopeptide (TPR) repeat protein
MSRTPLRLALIVLALAACPWSVALAQPPNRGERPDANQQRALSEYQAGWSHMRSENFEEALVSFQRALDLNPRLNLAHYGMGRAYLALRRYQEAIRALAACRDNYVVEAGRKFAGQSDANQARQDRLTELRDLQSQYQRAPPTAQNQDAVRQIQNAIRDTTDAAARGTNISIDASVPAFVSLSLGSAYFRAERMEDAEKEYRNAIKADSKSGEAHNNLAVIYFLSDRAPLALVEIKAAEKAGFRVNPDLKDQVNAAVKK